MSNPHETWWKWLTDGFIIFIKFHEDWTKIVDLLLIAFHFPWWTFFWIWSQCAFEMWQFIWNINNKEPVLSQIGVCFCCLSWSSVLTFLKFSCLNWFEQETLQASGWRLSKKLKKLRRSGHKFVVRGWVGPNLPKPALT